MTPDFMRALDLAREAHAKQVDKIGRPYVEHLERVGKATMQKVAHVGHLLSDGEISAIACAAVLHDIVEDTPLRLTTVRALYGDEIADMVGLVTKRPGEVYSAAIGRLVVSENLGAILIKLSDLEDNMDPFRRASLPEEERPVPEKYRLAHYRLAKAANLLGYAVPAHTVTTP
ncbi:HD domain-containing protein [uncultured Methylobacterium sp.]|uniref:HD domain-containing protein n=1 Tax=uncultured Methylobacterium sp. TaxID=157278 RepID=UPI0035CC50BD